MLLLLLGAASALLLLPMLPALIEWWRPSDVVPLAIDPADALDPPGFARSFAERLQRALDAGEASLGQSPIVSVAAGIDAAWPLAPQEAAATYNRRLWHVAGDAQLPPGQAFLAEVAAWGELRSAPGGVYRALLAGRGLYLAAASVVLRWAHARDVEVASGCRLAGRVSAEHGLIVHEQVRFTLLHAPMVRFTGSRPATDADDAVAARGEWAAPAFDAAQPVAWDAIAGRGVAAGSLDVASGQVWQGDLICRGRLRLGTGCHVRGSLKAHQDVRLAAGCSVSGSVVATGLVRLKRGCAVRGSVISETAVVLGAGCVVGAPGRPATVTAPRIEVAPGVLVHGTLWATEQGYASPRHGGAATAVAAAAAEAWQATVEAGLDGASA